MIRIYTMFLLQMYSLMRMTSGLLLYLMQLTGRFTTAAGLIKHLAGPLMFHHLLNVEDQWVATLFNAAHGKIHYCSGPNKTPGRIATLFNAAHGKIHYCSGPNKTPGEATPCPTIYVIHQTGHLITAVDLSVNCYAI